MKAARPVLVLLVLATGSGAWFWWTAPLRRLRRRFARLAMERAFHFVAEDASAARPWLGLDTPTSLTRSYSSSMTVDEVIGTAQRHLRTVGWSSLVDDRDGGVEIVAEDREPGQSGSALIVVTKDNDRTLIEVTVK
jgi:hypothetical protein